MGGGLMQLVAYGAQDIYLTGNPQITFFKVVYRRHTNFAMEAIEQAFNGVANFGNKVVCTVARNGDLVGRMILEIDIDDVSDSGVRGLGHKLIKSVEVEIGGQKIDKHYGEWMDIWAQLTNATGKDSQLTDMINGKLVGADDTGSTDVNKLYIPLQFWFNRNPGLALPLIALQYHEVKVIIEFNKQADIATVSAGTATALSGTTITNISLFCDYIFLDTDERRRFAQVSHEYLIEQLQTTGTCSFAASKQKVNIPVDFNHPCKQLVWVVQNENNKNSFDFTVNGTGNPAVGLESEQEFVTDAVLQLNGHDRFRRRSGSYFRIVQPYQHYGAAPSQGRTDNAAGDTKNPEYGYIYTYSFALKPAEHQPSGTCNFSRIDNAVLNMTLIDTATAAKLTTNSARSDDKNVRVYATNYNVLRIMSGMGGLAYSN